MSVVNFPAVASPPPLLIGPFEEYRVIVQGRIVPNLYGRKQDDGRVFLTVDSRFGAEFASEEVAAQAAWLVAQAMAVTAGYSHFEADDKSKPFAGIAVQIGDPNG